METEGSLPHSQEPANCFCPERLLRLYWRIISVPKPLFMIRNMFKFLRWRFLNTTPKSQAVGPPIIGCPRLFIQYIRNYPPYLEAVPPSATWGRAMPFITLRKKIFVNWNEFLNCDGASWLDGVGSTLMLRILYRRKHFMWSLWWKSQARSAERHDFTLITCTTSQSLQVFILKYTGCYECVRCCIYIHVLCFVSLIMSACLCVYVFIKFY